METSEIYILCKSRSKKKVLAFLDNILPNREKSAEDYPYPEYADKPEHVYDEVGELMMVLEENISESYSLYWRATDSSEVKNAMIFYTEDGGLVAGIVVESGECKIWLSKLSKLLRGEFGYVSFDSPPPATAKEFIARCKNSDQVRLVAGDILKAQNKQDTHHKR